LGKNIQTSKVIIEGSNGWNSLGSRILHEAQNWIGGSRGDRGSQEETARNKKKEKMIRSGVLGTNVESEGLGGQTLQRGGKGA